jgi:hypothetical protein
MTAPSRVSNESDADAERLVVWYAEGIVMSELHCTSDEAQSLMIELSRLEGMPLKSIACALVQRSLTRPLDEVFSRSNARRGESTDD